jgi:hypothetical protein
MTREKNRLRRWTHGVSEIRFLFLNFFLRPFLTKLCLLEVTTFIPQIEEKLNNWVFCSCFLLKAVISYLYEFEGETLMKWVTLGILYPHDPNCNHPLNWGEGQSCVSRGNQKLPKVLLSLPSPTTLLLVGGYHWNSFMATSRVATHKEGGLQPSYYPFRYPMPFGPGKGRGWIHTRELLNAESQLFICIYSEILLRRFSRDHVKNIVLLKHLLRHTSPYILWLGGDCS